MGRDILVPLVDDAGPGDAGQSGVEGPRLALHYEEYGCRGPGISQLHCC